MDERIALIQRKAAELQRKNDQAQGGIDRILATWKEKHGITATDPKEALKVADKILDTFDQDRATLEKELTKIETDLEAITDWDSL